MPTILPANPGELLATVPAELQPPAQAPLPALQVANVVDPPLPPVVNLTKPETVAPPNPAPSSGARACVNSVLSLVAISVLAMFFAGH